MHIILIFCPYTIYLYTAKVLSWTRLKKKIPSRLPMQPVVAVQLEQMVVSAIIFLRCWKCWSTTLHNLTTVLFLVLSL